MLSLRSLFNPSDMIQSAQRRGEIPGASAVYADILRLAIPAMLETMLVSFVTVVDTAMVGTLGTAAIAAVGITGQPRFIILVPFFALNVGITAIVSRRVGEGDYDDANRCVRQSAFIALVASSLLCVAAYFAAPEMMQFMGAPGEILPDAVKYYRIILIGIPLTAAGMGINAAQRGAGNTHVSARTNIAANIVNVVLNYLLIGGKLGFPALGISGAAIATVIGYAVAFLMSCRSLRAQGNILFVHTGDSFIPQADMLRSLAAVSGSAAVEQVFIRIGFITFIKMVSALGTVAFATHQICMNIMGLSFTAGEGIGIALAALVGQSLGRERPDMANIYGRCGLVVALAGSVFVAGVFTTLAVPIMGLFDSNTEVMRLGAMILFIIAAMAPGQMAQVMFSGCLRGAGDTKFVAFSSLLSTALARPMFGWLFCYPLGLGVVGAWIGIWADQYVRLAACYGRFRKGRWMEIKV